MKFVAVLVLLAGACGGASPAGTQRYADRPIVWKVNDRVHTPAPPEKEDYMWLQYYLEVFVEEPVTEALRVRAPRRAGNINALGEVPDSTWFTNRIGRFELTPEQVRRGPDGEGPEDHTPWTIKSTKIGGFTPGFLIEDARGVTYLLKFDRKGYPEAETGADVIVQRILWAAGYHVPRDYVVRFDKGDLILADDAVVADRFGNERPMRRDDVESALAQVEIEDGAIRGLVSEFLSGEPLGGHPRVGTRDGDPNDLVPIEDRRDVRGLYVFYAWLDQVDVKTENMLDMYVEDPEVPGWRYVVHYLVDFGTALGVTAYRDERPRAGFAYVVDFEHLFKRLATLGLYRGRWAGLERADIRGVGRFEAERFEPDRWTPGKRYLPFVHMDRFDAFWAAKIIMRFTRAHLEAAAENARFTDPRAAPYIVDTLIARQRKTARHWFSKVAPLDRFEVSAEGQALRLCFTDLLVHHDLVGPGAPAPQVTATAYDYEGDPTGWRRVVTPDGDGNACLAPVPRAEYLIVHLETSRGEPPVLVHLAGDRLIGLYRR